MDLFLNLDIGDPSYDSTLQLAWIEGASYLSPFYRDLLVRYLIYIERLDPYCVLVYSRMSSQTEQLYATRTPEQDLSPNPKHRAVSTSNILNRNAAQMLAQKSLPIRNVILDSTSSYQTLRPYRSQNLLRSRQVSHLFHPREC